MATNTTTDAAQLGYFTIIGKVEEADESSYERAKPDGSAETVTRIQLSLVVPGMQDRVRCELPLEASPTTDTLAQWELEESWVVVSASGMRALAFKRSNARAGEKEVGSLVIFAGTGTREATSEERKQLQQARRAQKVAAKQRRAARQAERQAEKLAQKEAAERAEGVQRSA